LEQSEWEKAEGKPYIRCRRKALRLIEGICRECLNRENEDSLWIMEFRGAYDEAKRSGVIK